MMIAVTGSLGSGKSTASKILANFMAAGHVDTDQLCRMEMLPGRRGYEDFRKIFGNRFLNPDGSLDRVRLRRAVFGDSGIKAALENILHPLVRKQVADLNLKCRLSSKIMVVEVPLLFEVGWQKDFDVTVVVHIPEELSLTRVRLRDGLSAEDAGRVVAQQLPVSLKMQYADFVIDNSGTFAGTFLQLAWLGKKLKCGRKNVESISPPAKKLDSSEMNTYKGNNDLKSIPVFAESPH